MQHVKLTALCDLFDLFDRADRTLFPVSWRADPRPVEGRAARHVRPSGRRRAMAVTAMQTASTDKLVTASACTGPGSRTGIEALLSAGALTPEGKRFVNGMRSTVEAWADDR